MLLRVWVKKMMPVKNKATANSNKKGGTSVPPFLWLTDMIST